MMDTDIREIDALRAKSLHYDPQHVCIFERKSPDSDVGVCMNILSFAPGEVVRDIYGVFHANGDIFVCEQSRAFHVCRSREQSCVVSNDGDRLICIFSGKELAKCFAPASNAPGYLKAYYGSNAVSLAAFDEQNILLQVCGCRRKTRKRTKRPLAVQEFRPPKRRRSRVVAENCAVLTVAISREISGMFKKNVTDGEDWDADLKKHVQQLARKRRTNSLFHNYVDCLHQSGQRPFQTTLPPGRVDKIISGYASLLQDAWLRIGSSPAYTQIKDKYGDYTHQVGGKIIAPRLEMHCNGFFYILMRTESMSIEIPDSVIERLAAINRNPDATVETMKGTLCKIFGGLPITVILCERDEFLCSLLSEMYNSSNKTTRENRPKADVNSTKRIYQTAMLSYLKYYQYELCNDVAEANSYEEMLLAVMHFKSNIENLSLRRAQAELAKILN